MKYEKELTFITLGTLLGIIIAIAIPLIGLLIAYWAFNQMYKTSRKSKKNSNAQLFMELDSLKKRVELLEKKSNND